VPNQIHQPTTSPTLRWVFQLVEGIHRVRVTVQGHGHERIESLTDVQINMLRVFGNEVCHLYHISPIEGCSMSVSMPLYCHFLKF
jgi:hypothetical protein